MQSAETDPPLLVPGGGAKSQLFLVAAHQSDSVMPPDDNDVGAKNLTPHELGLLRLWIDQGAKPSDTVRNLLKKEGFFAAPAVSD